MQEAHLKIVAWDLFTPFGDKQQTHLAVAARRRVDAQAGGPVHTVPDFDIRTQLGQKGTRSFDRHTALFVKCASNVIEVNYAASDRLQEAAIINGTATGSVSSIFDFLLDTYRNERPYFVNPAHMPNTVMNCAAGQCAIRHGIRGPNATVSAGGQSFYAALKMADRWARKDFARTFLVGAVEEVTPTTAMLFERCSADRGVAAHLSESAGVFALETLEAGDQHSAASCIVHVELGTDTAAAGSPGTLLSRLVGKALQRSGVEASQIRMVCVESAAGSAAGAAEQAVCAALPTAEVFDISQHFGLAYSAAGALQLAVLMGELPEHSYGLMCSASANGSVACAVVKKGAALH